MDADMIPKGRNDASVDVNSKLVHALKQLQLDRNRKEAELHLKIKQLKAEYDATFAEFDAKRRAIVTGAYVPIEEECKYEFADAASAEPFEHTEKGIPGFWSNILHNVELLRDIISPADEEMLKYLVDVRCVNLGNLLDFRLEFEFSENQCFRNKVLTKEYHYSTREDSSNPLKIKDPIVSHWMGCKIFSLLLPVEIMPNYDKIDWKQKEFESFLEFFVSPPVPAKVDIKIGELLRDKVIPRAITYFTGSKGIEDNDESDEEEIDEEEIVEEEINEEIDEEESDEEEINEEIEEEESDEKIAEEKIAEDDKDDEDSEESEDDCGPVSKKFKCTGSRGGCVRMAKM